jgi:hypothetical protein
MFLSCGNNFVKQNLTDQYIQNWFNQIENSSRGEFYGIFKKVPKPTLHR